MRFHHRPALALGLGFLAVLNLAAWDDHDQLTAAALGAEPYAAEELTVEPLEDFLRAEAPGLAEELGRIETRARSSLDYYAPLPEELAFSGALPAEELRAAFLRALRINPRQALPLFVQVPLGAPRTRPELPVTAADLLDCRIPNPPFAALAPGEAVTALEVLATASDEPDYGMDIGLYEDNPGGVGSAYGFGVQPFGNPTLSYGSQAPFHMSFSQENPLISLAAPFTRKSLTAYRVLLYESLARFAFRTGHAYWGYRFAGWTLHYLEDQAQPYHASLLPGLTAGEILALNAFGGKEKRDAALVFLSNRHTLIEDYAYRSLVEDAEAGAKLRAALAGEGGRAAPAYRDRFVLDVIAAGAYRRGRALDQLLAGSFPARYVADPSYDYGVMNAGSKRDFDPRSYLVEKNPEAAAELDAATAALFADIGGSLRAFLVWVRAPETPLPPRQKPLDLRGPAYLAILALIAAGIFLLALRRRARPQSTRAEAREARRG